jgi:hypothetical protein
MRYRFHPIIRNVNLIKAAQLLKYQNDQFLNKEYNAAKGPRLFFGPFLKFGHAIVDAIFVQKISSFW